MVKDIVLNEGGGDNEIHPFRRYSKYKTTRPLSHLRSKLTVSVHRGVSPLVSMGSLDL